MNLAPLLKVADMIEAEVAEHNQGKIRFDMSVWGENHIEDENDCFTAACIAGHVVAVSDPGTWRTLLENDNGSEAAGLARDILDLTPKQAMMLFSVTNGKDEDIPYMIHYWKVTRKAHLVPGILRWMVANNSVDWWDAVEALNLRGELATPVF
jgi:hypothetical protein